MKTELSSFQDFCEGYVGGKIGDPIQRNQLFNITQLKEQYHQIINALRCNYRRNAITVKCPDCKNKMILLKNLDWVCVRFECYFKGKV